MAELIMPPTTIFSDEIKKTKLPIRYWHHSEDSSCPTRLCGSFHSFRKQLNCWLARFLFSWFESLWALQGFCDARERYIYDLGCSGLI
jgi:hypothetical protein